MNESRSVDDQIEWIDSETPVYELPRSAAAQEGDTDIVVRRIGAEASSRVLLQKAGSPSMFD